ncbi:MAG: hypothetical protein ACYSW8_26520 [Planctomycetota bacterium]|jgi:hypothetical protein
MSHLLTQPDNYNWKSAFVDYTYIGDPGAGGIVVQAANGIRVKGIRLRTDTIGKMGVYDGDYSNLLFVVKMNAVAQMVNLREFYSANGLALRTIGAGAARTIVFHQSTP